LFCHYSYFCLPDFLNLGFDRGSAHEREIEQQANVNAAGADNGAAEPDDAVTDAPESEISEEGPPPQVVDKRLTGRIRPEWKSPNDF